MTFSRSDDALHWMLSSLTCLFREVAAAVCLLKFMIASLLLLLLLLINGFDESTKLFQRQSHE